MKLFKYEGGSLICEPCLADHRKGRAAFPTEYSDPEPGLTGEFVRSGECTHCGTTFWPNTYSGQWVVVQSLSPFTSDVCAATGPMEKAEAEAFVEQEKKRRPDIINVLLELRTNQPCLEC